MQKTIPQLLAVVRARASHAIPEANRNAPEAANFSGSEQRTRLGRGKLGIERGSDNLVARSLPTDRQTD